MTWAKLDDGFWMHPKIVGAGNAGAGMFTRMLSYCGCYLTDGLIPSSVVQIIAGNDHASLESLERVGLVQLLDTGGIIIPDYLEHNKSKAQVEADREQRKDAGRSSGRRRAEANAP